VNQLSSPIRHTLRAAALSLGLIASGLALQLHPALAQNAPAAPAAPAQPAKPAAAAGPATTIPMGVIDSQVVLNTSSVGKSLNAQWTASLKALNDDMAKKENALRAQAQQLEMQRSANPPISVADYNTKRKGLEDQDNQNQATYAKNRQALDQRRNKALETVTTAARKAMTDVAKAHNLTVVFDRSAVPYSPEPWNITDEVLARLNKALPNVKL